ncbi:hypothetical protein E4U61_005864 [Claviceps capensis]|nr:hypothetical protein E4U61_005864 [Claviceps capensis]
MSSQRPFFLSSFFAAFRQRGPTLQTNSPSNKHQSTVVGSSSASSAGYAQTSAGAARAISTTAAGTSSSAQQAGTRSPRSSLSIHSPRGASGGSASGIPVPGTAASGRRRGSDSSSEGFRDARGAEKWYIGGRTAGGEERFFKLGVVKRVRSNDGLSLDRLSL